MQGRLAIFEDVHFDSFFFFVMIHVSETQAVQLLNSSLIEHLPAQHRLPEGLSIPASLAPADDEQQCACSILSSPCCHLWKQVECLKALQAASTAQLDSSVAALRTWGTAVRIQSPAVPSGALLLNL